MNSIDEQSIQVLQGLIEVCSRRRASFTHAAEYLEGMGLRDLLLGYAAERAGYLAELRGQIFALGGNGEKSAGFVASLYRGWTQVAATAASKDPATVLNRCERDEQAAVAAYHQPLSPALDPATRSLIGRQARGIAASHRCLKLLRDRLVEEESASPYPAL